MNPLNQTMVTKRSQPIVQLKQASHGEIPTVLVKSFQHTTGGIIQYKLYFGRDAPPTFLGIPGDMYIDTSPEANRLFIRYESWREWPGVYRPPGRHRELQFSHPNDRSKTVWCSPNDVLWYKKKSFYVAKRACLLHYPNVLFVSAHELIQRTGLLPRCDAPIQDHVSPSPSRVSPSPSLNTAPAPPTNSVEVSNSLCVREESLISGNTVPSSTDNNPSSSSYGPFIMIPSSSAHDPSATLDTHQVSNLRSSADLQQSVISRHERTFEGANGQTIRYTVYHGLERPSIDLGRLGDMFVDVTPGTYRLFIRYESWRQWPGIYDQASTSPRPLVHDFSHPQDPTRVAWCTQSEVLWYKRISTKLGMMRLFSCAPYIGASFIPAHDLIQRSGIPRRAAGKRLQLDSGNSGEVEVTKRRRIERSMTRTENDSINKSSSVADIDDAFSGNLLRLPSLSTTSSSTAAVSTDGHSKLPSRKSLSLSPKISPVLRLPTRYQSPIPDLSHSDSESRDSSVSSSPDNDTQNSNGEGAVISDVNTDEAVQVAQDISTFKEKYEKQKMRYAKRNMELSRRDAELAKQEEELHEEVRRARMRLKKAKQDAIRRNEEAKRRDEELQRHKAEVTALEEKLFHQEQELRKRKKIIEKVQGSISLWEQV